jgi:hypothetical protein
VKLTDKKVSKDELFKANSEDANETIPHSVSEAVPE